MLDDLLGPAVKVPARASRSSAPTTASVDMELMSSMASQLGKLEAAQRQYRCVCAVPCVACFIELIAVAAAS